MVTQEAKHYKLEIIYVHIIVMLAFIIGFAYIPPLAPITPIGMRLVGIFLAVLYGWTTCGMLWPSMLGMVAVALSGILSMKDFVALIFGNETVIFILFLFFFTGVIEEVGLIGYIANKMISFKILNGKPWLFSMFLLIGAYIAAAFINMFAAVIVFWGIIYVVAERFDFKPYDKYPTLMIIGVSLACSVGGCVMPYKPVPIVVLKAYSTIAGVPMDFFQYICFSLPVSLTIMIFYVFICRFLFRPDMKALRQISIDFVDTSALSLTNKQKVVVGFLVTFIFLMIAPSILPGTWLLAKIISQLGIVGCLFILLILMQWVKLEHKPLLEFSIMAKHVNWDVVFIMGFVIPFAGIFTGNATGIKEWIVQIMQPLLIGHAPIIFIILTLLFATLLTNIANNMVIGVIFVTLIFTIGNGIGIEIAPVVAVLIICINLALATPAASPVAAMTFGNIKWCKAIDLYKYGTATVLIGFAFAACIGLLWATFIY